MKRFILIVSLLFSASVFAAHDWGGVDICEVRRDIMPPGIEPAVLAEPDSEGAVLVQRYCTQCHYLPGPGRHTAEEWPAVLERMDVLMSVSRFYRGLLGSVDRPNEHEQQVMSDYLKRNALRPLPLSIKPLPVTINEQTYRSVCGDCHTSPDPRRYENIQWSELIKRMEQHRAVMGRLPLTPAQQTAVTAFLNTAQQGPLVAGSGHSGNAALPLLQTTAVAQDSMGRWLSLGVFFGLTGAGLWRWRRRGN